ncbi:TPA: SDR family NAD(P)-dependent oxidoreductase, partial [Vibrio vulnificus]|nr:SDR family NAD(P)-dependent oxidoreductase [Vibrio vulnificus]HDZ3726056.1 SDR family NAD(P)-dependent oxidoreductase [Vibrio vulnificus]
MNVLVTGGMGYIGSHTCVQMMAAGMEPIIVDNLCNAKVDVLSRIEALTGKQPTFYQGDIRDEAFLDSVFAQHDIQA